MALLPRRLARQIPRLYLTDRQPDQMAYARLHLPDDIRAWYILERDPDNDYCFGLIVGERNRIDYFSLADLAVLRGPQGMSVCCDLNWEPLPLSQCR